LSEWYESFFDALAFDVWRSLVPKEMSDREADFLIRHLAGTGASRCRLLDVPCGDGRLALPVAAAGHEVVGVDLSAIGIERMRHDAKGAPGVTALVGDMRRLGSALGPEEPFDGAWCMGNSFSYLDTIDTMAFLEGVAASLRVGAGFVVDAAAVAELALPHLGRRDRYEANGAILTNVHSYDARRSTMVTDMTLEFGESRAQRIVRHRVMTCREIIESLERSDLIVEEVFGGLDDEPFSLGSGRCLIVARRRFVRGG